MNALNAPFFRLFNSSSSSRNSKDVKSRAVQTWNLSRVSAVSAAGLASYDLQYSRKETFASTQNFVMFGGYSQKILNLS